MRESALSPQAFCFCTFQTRPKLRVVGQALRRLLQLSVVSIHKELADLDEQVLHSVLPRPVLNDSLDVNASLRVLGNNKQAPV